MKVSDRRIALLIEIDQLEVKFQSDLKLLHSKLYELQLDCPHNWKYYPDPSGNNDSCYACKDCDKEVKRLPKV